MAIKPNEQRRYAAYLLRLWQVNDAEPPIWHASLEDPHTGERIGFANLMSLCAFLERQIAKSSPGVVPATSQKKAE
jgi:hypothetical protein